MTLEGSNCESSSATVRCSVADGFGCDCNRYSTKERKTIGWEQEETLSREEAFAIK